MDLGSCDGNALVHHPDVEEFGRDKKILNKSRKMEAENFLLNFLKCNEDLNEECDHAKLLIVEPYFIGVHKRLIDVITSSLPSHVYTVIKMSGKKLNWRSRTSALWVSTQIPKLNKYKVLFASSVLPLAELIGLRPDLAKLYKIIYFHENQLCQPILPRDFQYAYNEILSCIAADQVLFNSSYNKGSFIKRVGGHLRQIPDYHGPPNVEQIIEFKSKVVFFPVNLSAIEQIPNCAAKPLRKALHILWPCHRECDSDPDELYRLFEQLDLSGYEFMVYMVGNYVNRYNNHRVKQLGNIENDIEFYQIVKQCDVVISGADQEFFGLPIMEAVYGGCIPLVPKRLVYNELYGGRVREMYNSIGELTASLVDLIHQKEMGHLRNDYRHLAMPYDAEGWFRNVMRSLDRNLLEGCL